MMPSDPRQRNQNNVAAAAPAAAPSPSKPILLGGEDAMEEDEDRPQQQQQQSIFNDPQYLQSQQQQQQQQQPQLATHQQQHHFHNKEQLISQIITPSPYPHHNTGPMSSRFRNALGRITTHPRSDVEAWQVIITEAYACYRAILPTIHTMNAETQAKLDWMESCYGTLLLYFPYASNYYVSIVEMLLAQSARVGEEDGPLVDYGLEPSQRALVCEAKVEYIFRSMLGIEMNGNPATTTQDGETNQTSSTTTTTTVTSLGGMCTSSVELWLLYIRKRVRDAYRHAASTGMMTSDEVDGLVREWTIKAYETALTHASFVINNHVLWKQYLTYVKSWIPNPATNTDHGLAQKQMLQLRSIYQRIAVHPMTGLDQLWQEYEIFERVQNENLASALIAEFVPKYQHARSVYLDRNRAYNAAAASDFQLDRLATPPIGDDDDDDSAAADSEDYGTRLGEEIRLLTLWKKRISYERTNPERLTPSELAVRIRHCYKEMACILTFHPEVWHMWSMWELLAAAATSGTPGGCPTDDRVQLALTVLRLSQLHIPDCTLLSYAESQMVESHTTAPSNCVNVMEQFLERSPNTLGFILYQHMVRRYKGMAAARAVFAKARRVLREPADDSKHESKRGDGDGTSTTTAVAIAKSKDVTDGGGTDGHTDDTGGATGDGANSRDSKDDTKRWMVTNRLDPSVGIRHVTATATESKQLSKESNVKSEQQQQQQQHHGRHPIKKAGPITWQLFASHANIEHRLNRSPETAARVYELGLRKHVSFLTKTPYVLRYAHLLLELQDSENLRALLTRAISACEAQQGSTGKQQQQHRHASVIPLWDMALRFESTWSGSDPSNVPAFYTAERKRRAALMGQDVEDVAVGGILGVSGGGGGDSKIAGNATISEQLIRSDGYDVSSNIVSGLSRMVDVLEVVGFLGSGGGGGDYSYNYHELPLHHRTAKDADDDTAQVGGKSDASYQKRIKFQNLLASGLSVEAALAEGATAAAAGVGGASKIITARERFQQAAVGAGGASAVAQTHNNPMALAIQQSPEWLRPLLLLLPASKYRSAVVSKPLAHVTEMALTALRQYPLPPERPNDDGGNGGGFGGDVSGASFPGTKKRKSDGGGGDSSDDENGDTGRGYGSQFRARQRARQVDLGQLQQQQQQQQQQPNGVIADS